MRLYRIRADPHWVGGYIVERRRHWWFGWVRCKGVGSGTFSSVDDAKKAIPMYDKNSVHWTGTMVDLTADRIT